MLCTYKQIIFWGESALRSIWVPLKAHISPRAVWPNGYVIFQSLAIYVIKNLPHSIKIAKVSTKVFQKPNKKIPIYCSILP